MLMLRAVPGYPPAIWLAITFPPVSAPIVDFKCTSPGFPIQFTFNGFLKVAFQGSRVTSDAGLILVRELDERLGLENLIAEHLSDSRQGLNT